MVTSKAVVAGLILAAISVLSAGCAQAPPPDAAPPPNADAHPLPVVQGKHPHPKLPKLPGDTRPDAP